MLATIYALAAVPGENGFRDELGAQHPIADLVEATGVNSDVVRMRVARLVDWGLVHGRRDTRPGAHPRQQVYSLTEEGRALRNLLDGPDADRHPVLRELRRQLNRSAELRRGKLGTQDIFAALDAARQMLCQESSHGAGAGPSHETGGPRGGPHFVVDDDGVQITVRVRRNADEGRGDAGRSPTAQLARWTVLPTVALGAHLAGSLSGDPAFAGAVAVGAAAVAVLGAGVWVAGWLGRAVAGCGRRVLRRCARCWIGSCGRGGPGGWALPAVAMVAGSWTAAMVLVAAGASFDLSTAITVGVAAAVAVFGGMCLFERLVGAPGAALGAGVTLRLILYPLVGSGVIPGWSALAGWIVTAIVTGGLTWRVHARRPPVIRTADPLVTDRAALDALVGIDERPGASEERITVSGTFRMTGWPRAALQAAELDGNPPAEIDAVVSVETLAGRGTAFMIRNDGTSADLVTNEHLFAHVRTARVSIAGTVRRGVAALLQFPRRHPPRAGRGAVDISRINRALECQSCSVDVSRTAKSLAQ